LQKSYSLSVKKEDSFMTFRLLALCLCFINGISNATPFLPDTDDVPLMADLSPCNDDTQGLFSAPVGRIVSLVVSGKTSWNYVSNFYEQSLRNLGWQPALVSTSKNVLEFSRGTEKLTITEIKNRNGILFLRFDYVEG
jgi:hypothetical protein